MDTPPTQHMFESVLCFGKPPTQHVLPPTQRMLQAVIRNPMIRKPLIRNPMIRKPVIRNPVIRKPMIRNPMIRNPMPNHFVTMICSTHSSSANQKTLR